MMITYAQNREDVLLQRVFPKDHEGFYIDVGANDPVHDSVTKHFSLRGWRGINIEPHPELHRALRDDRPNDVNLNVGASDRHATLEFLECVSNSGLSTFSPSMAEIWRRDDGLEFVARSVPVRPLAAILDEHAEGRTIDFLKIDAEAHEFEVVSGNDWSRWRPRVVLVEATFPERWEPLLLKAGYLSAAFDGINLYYVRGEEPELLGPFKTPASGDDCVPHRARRSAVQQPPSRPPHDRTTRRPRLSRARERLARACKRLTGFGAPPA